MKEFEFEKDGSDRTLYEVASRIPQVGQLHGSLNALFEVWERSRGEALAPPWSQFDWDSAPADLVPSFAVVEVRRHPLDFIYRYWGTERTRLQGRDYTGCSVNDFRPRAIALKAFGEYTKVVETRAPLYLTTYGLTDSNSAPFTYHLLRLPYSEDGMSVDHILGVGLYDRRATRQAEKFYGTASKAND